MKRRQFIKTLALSTGATLVRAEPAGIPSLRKLAGKKLPIGVALHAPVYKTYTPAELALTRKHFSIITPENCMKWDVCQRVPGPRQLEKADGMLAFAEKHNQKFLGHTLLFNRSNEYPEWVFKDGEGKASRQLVEERLRDHINTMMGRYKGRIYAWDVVNEAVEEKEPYYRETDWFEMFGGEFVPMAFRMAKEADPNALLIYNDYRVEEPVKLERILLLLEELRGKGVLPDVVGIQGHWELDDVPFEKLEKTIVALHEAGVRVSVTELDIDIMSRSLYWNHKTRPEAIKQDPYRDGCPDDVLARQAEQYGQLFKLFVKHAEKMERITLWGLTDAHSWLNSWPWERVNHGLLFDREARPKPAFFAVADALRNA